MTRLLTLMVGSGAALFHHYGSECFSFYFTGKVQAHLAFLGRIHYRLIQCSDQGGMLRHLCGGAMLHIQYTYD